MHALEFPVTLRYLMPKAKNPDLQTLYVFNMYRAGSSVLAAVAPAVAVMSGRVHINITQDFNRFGVTIFDIENWRSSNIFLNGHGADLMQLTEMGGYLHYGYREIPSGFAEQFNSLAASVLIARDLRDIGMSHYRAIDKHTTTDSRVNKATIEGARQLKSGKNLHEYILSPELLKFLKRVGQCYKPLIEKGITIIRYEELFDEQTGNFSVPKLCARLVEAFEDFSPGLEVSEVLDYTRRAIENSEHLKGHATSGGFGYYRNLPPDIREKYTKALSDELSLLGYTD